MNHNPTLTNQPFSQKQQTTFKHKQNPTAINRHQPQTQKQINKLLESQ